MSEKGLWQAIFQSDMLLNTLIAPWLLTALSSMNQKSIKHHHEGYINLQNPL